MNLKTQVQKAVQALSGNTKTKNSLQSPEANNFLRYGNQQPLIQNWSQVEMSDEDSYTGYGYAAINKRADRTSVIGRRFIGTEASQATIAKYKETDTELIHPYLKIINKSKEFTKKEFWYEISTYLDLEGIYYLMAVRAVDKSEDGTVNKIGAVQSFKLINPYEVRRVIKESTGEVGGYVESHNGLYREIPPEMIIEIKQLNPFNKDNPYSMSDAAKESQFTLKQAGDYTRQTINGNIASPGIITTDVLLDDSLFENFRNRIVGRQKGEPIFGNGAGAINWQDMQIDLDNAALDKINEINRSILFAVSGVSKTSMGIEESGTGREVSKTQRDDFTENAIIPRCEDIVGALNLDYRKWYPEWEDNEFEIIVGNPLESDRDAELKDIKIRDNEYALAESMYAKGYEWEISVKYAHGDIKLEELGMPTREVDDIEDEDIDDDTPIPTDDTTGTQDDSEETETISDDTTIKNSISSKDYEDVLSDVVPDDLGCIMMGVEKLPVLQHFSDPESDLAEADYSSVPGEDSPHVTLLYGLLENGNTWKSKVDKLLDGSSLNELIIDHVGFFDLDDKKVVVAFVKPSTELLDAHDRLTLLPHVNTFSEYVPHISLAYVNNDADIGKWVTTLDSIYRNKHVKTTCVDYGDKKKDDKEDNSLHIHKEHGELSQSGLILAENSLDSDTRDIVKAQENSLQAGIAKIELDIIESSMNMVTLNSYSKTSDIISEEDRNKYLNELQLLFNAYYTFLFPIYGRQLMSKRASEYGQLVPYQDNQSIKNYIESTAKKASESHMETVLDDILSTTNTAYQSILDEELISIVSGEVSKGSPAYISKLPANPTLEQISKAVKNGDFDNTKAYVQAKELADNGVSRNKIARIIQQEYPTIAKNRATTIARTETARAFNQSQFQADTQFLNNSGLMPKAYKKLRSRSGAPCVHCQMLINKPPIPFNTSFAELGSELSATVTRENGSVVVKKLPVSYEAIDSGNVHVNCQCEYVLIIDGYNK